MKSFEPTGCEPLTEKNYIFAFEALLLYSFVGLQQQPEFCTIIILFIARVVPCELEAQGEKRNCQLVLFYFSLPWYRHSATLVVIYFS